MHIVVIIADTPMTLKWTRHGRRVLLRISCSHLEVIGPLIKNYLFIIGFFSETRAFVFCFCILNDWYTHRVKVENMWTNLIFNTVLIQMIGIVYHLHHTMPSVHELHWQFALQQIPCCRILLQFCLLIHQLFNFRRASKVKHFESETESQR